MLIAQGCNMGLVCSDDWDKVKVQIQAQKKKLDQTLADIERKEIYDLNGTNLVK